MKTAGYIIAALLFLSSLVELYLSPLTTSVCVNVVLNLIFAGGILWYIKQGNDLDRLKARWDEEDKRFREQLNHIKDQL